MAILESITIELKSIRYLINNIIVLLFDIKKLLTLLLAKENIKLPKEKKKTRDEVIQDGIKFDMFELNQTQYNALLGEFGYDITCRACAMLDDYVRDKGYVPYGKPALALRKVMIVHALKEKLDSQKVGVVTFKDIDHNLIDNKKDALAFIESIPKHIRNVSPEVRELVERFNINYDRD